MQLHQVRLTFQSISYIRWAVIMRHESMNMTFVVKLVQRLIADCCVDIHTCIFQLLWLSTIMHATVQQSSPQTTLFSVESFDIVHQIEQLLSL